SIWPLKNLPGGLYNLPGSYGVFTEDGSQPRVRLDVIGSLKGKDIVKRTSIISLLSQETRFMRMTIVEKCEDGKPNATCPKGLTCIEGSCQDQVRDVRTLPLYVAGMEAKFDCSSGTTYIDTAQNNAAIIASGSCTAGQQ